MTFGAPLALWGLTLLLGPVLVHLLSRRTTRRQAFPSLRLLGASRVPPVSRRTLDDRGLLLLRLLIVLLAVLAVAQPRWSNDAATPTDASARVVIVDTSASMHRGITVEAAGNDVARTPPSLLDVARGRADSLERSARLLLRLDTHDPAAALPAAAQWLSDAGGGELVVLYDGQRDVLWQRDVQGLPGAISVRVEVVGSARDSVAARADMLRVDVHGVADDDAFAWLRTRVAAVEPDVELVRADRAALPATALDTLRHLGTYAGLADEPLVQDIRRVGAVRAVPSDRGGWWEVRDARDTTVLLVRESGSLAVHPVTSPRDPWTAALIVSAIARYRDRISVPRQEVAPRTVDSAGLAALQRTRETTPSDARASVPDTRWTRLLWCLALIALGVESYWRARLAPRDVAMEVRA